MNATVKFEKSTVSNIIRILKSVMEIHDVDEYNQECHDDCEACMASEILKDIFNQIKDNDPNLLKKFNWPDN